MALAHMYILRYTLPMIRKSHSWSLTRTRDKSAEAFGPSIPGPLGGQASARSQCPPDRFISHFKPQPVHWASVSHISHILDLVPRTALNSGGAVVCLCGSCFPLSRIRFLSLPSKEHSCSASSFILFALCSR